MPFRSASSSGDPERRLVAVHDRGRPRISVVVPARNEAANLPYVLAALPPEVYEVVLVDGRSSDGTVEVARELRPDIRVVQQTRRGKGNALACGFAAVRGDIIVMLDADGSADPQEITRYVDVLLEGADFAKGTRFAAGGGSSDLTRLRSVGNKALNLVVNLLYGTHYTDLCYGYNAFWTRCLPVMGLDPGESQEDKKRWGDGFEIETIINTRIARGRLKVVEVPSYELERIHGVSNLNTWRDGFRVLRAALTVVEVPSFELERIHGVSNLNTWRDGFRVLRAALTERLRPRPSRRDGHPLVIDLSEAVPETEAATA